MKPPVFDYHAPSSTEEVLDLLSEYGDEAKVLAGGQSLIPAMSFRLAQPTVLIDLNPLEEMAFIAPHSEGGIKIGAMTRQRSIERSPLVAERAPLVSEAMPSIAHPQIRNRGTFGGSLAHADPAAELPAVALALDAELCLRSRGGERRLKAHEFYTGLFETALQPEEFLAEVILPPMAPRSGWAFQEVSRRHGDYALVGAAAVVTLDDNSDCRQARLTLLSVGDGPVEAVQCGALLRGQSLGEESLRAAAAAAATVDIDPPGDIHASVAYRRHLVQVLAYRVLEAAVRRARQAARL